MKKFELTTDFIVDPFEKKLFRIKALVDFGSVNAGDIGGYVEKYENLEQSGDAWVSENAQVSGNARVRGNAWVLGNARVSGNARVLGYAQVLGNAWVSGNAWVLGKVQVLGKAWVAGDARVSRNADILHITGLGSLHGTTTIFKAQNGLMVSCECFLGDLDTFKKQVCITRTGKVRDEYLKFVELAEIYFSLK